MDVTNAVSIIIARKLIHFANLNLYRANVLVMTSCLNDVIIN